jgi:osmotically-inducible protein OsmY
MRAGIVVALIVAAVPCASAFAQDRGRSAPALAPPLMVDSTVGDRVYWRLAERLPISADIDVRMPQPGVVMIVGTVPTEAMKRQALRVARRTRGVIDVRDELRVEGTRATIGDAEAADAQLARRVAERIASAIAGTKAGEDWWSSGWRVEGPDHRWTIVIEADDGTVWIDGDVPRTSLIRTAIENAREVDGVRAVRNEMELDR